MYDYEESANPLNPLFLAKNVDVYLDDTPTEYPYVARICATQGYFLIWHTSETTYPEITPLALSCKNEKQSKTCPELHKIEIGQAVIYPFTDEVIIGTIKYYNYMKILGQNKTNKIIKAIWKDIIAMFGDRKIICPSGSYFEWLHMSINQKKIPHSSYKENLMKSMGFKRVGNYWIRNANLLA